MPLVKAQCTNCNGALEVDDSKEAAVCPYCGTPYIVEKAINNYRVNTINISNSVVNFSNSCDDIEKMVNRAEKYILMGDDEKACRLYEKIVDLYPDDYRGWLGRLRYMQSLYWKGRSYSVSELYNVIQECIEINTEIKNKVKEAILYSINNSNYKCFAEDTWEILLKVCPENLQKGHIEAQNLTMQLSNFEKVILAYWFDYEESGRWEEWGEDKYTGIYDVLLNYIPQKSIDESSEDSLLPCILDGYYIVNWGKEGLLLRVSIENMKELICNTINRCKEAEQKEKNGYCHLCGKKKSILGRCKNEYCRYYKQYFTSRFF